MRKNSRGLTMPEVMVAMTILFVVSSFIMTMFVTGMRQTGQATQNQDLENLTRKKLAELRVMPYAQLGSEVVTDAPFSPAPADDRYRYSVSLSPLPGEDPARTTIVQVTVTHPDYGVRTARTVRCEVIVDPGQAAFEKFGCVQCHTLPQAGAAASTDRVPLGPITPTSTTDYAGRGLSGPNPSNAEWESYIAQSVADPGAVNAYAGSAQETDLIWTDMVGEFYVEGVDPEFDPASTDPVIASNSMSSTELNAIATWLAQFQP